jgi:hypothetical protein
MEKYNLFAVLVHFFEKPKAKVVPSTAILKGSNVVVLFLLVHSSSSNIVLKIAKRLLKGRGEKVKKNFVHGPRIWFVC